MESPLGPAVANFFPAHLENQFMTQQHIFMCVYYSGYIDDIFCVFNSLEYTKMFLNLLNNLHPKYKFTYEIGLYRLAFLDTKISLSSNNHSSLISNVYRKPSQAKHLGHASRLMLENHRLAQPLSVLASSREAPSHKGL